MSKKKKQQQKEKNPAQPKKDFSHPWPLDDVDVAFPAHALDFMPSMEELPEEVKQRGVGNGTKWHKFCFDWFFRGSQIKELKVSPKEGINPQLALRHLGAVIGSFAPKHEHKEAAFAYLCSLWFEDVSYVVEDKHALLGLKPEK